MKAICKNNPNLHRDCLMKTLVTIFQVGKSYNHIISRLSGINQNRNCNREGLLQYVISQAATNSTACMFKPNITRKTICYFYHESVNTLLVQTSLTRVFIVQQMFVLFNSLTLRLLMSYIYGAPSKARNANVVYIWTYVWQR